MKISLRRLQAIGRGSLPMPDELGELVRLALLGRAVESAPEVVVLHQSSMQVERQTWRHSWHVDASRDEPDIAGLLGHRLRVVTQEKVLQVGKRKDDADALRLMPDVRPPRGWK